MNQLNVSTGLVTYTVNGSCEISFNPTDAEFASQAVKTFEKISDICQNTEMAPDVDIRAFMDVTKKVDMEIRQEIDALFGESVCDKVFGKTNVLSLAQGLPIWANFLMAIIDEMDRAVTEEKKQASPRAQQYIKKYEKKYIKQ